MIKKINVFFGFCAVLLLAGISLYPVFAVGLGNCYSDSEFKKEFSETDHSFQYISLNIISSLAIKAGSLVQEEACSLFSQDGSNGCYLVTGIGTNSVTVTENWTSDDNKPSGCKDISHIEYITDLASSLETPTPTITLTVSPTPTETTRATETPTQAATPAADPSVTPSAVLTPTISVTSTPTETLVQASGATSTPAEGSSVSNDNSGRGGPSGEVLGISTYADTGWTTDCLWDILGVVSLCIFSSGVILSVQPSFKR